ncbi:sugar transporter [Lactobacillus sp. CBA3605]|uniref:GRP family sugar transporter n=1 Tax=Lactobacillus sp. CBA3605 TaxID=2099788 RepID=UPI000CFC3EB5|nr:GRP family sugar transporter [Lactobacillus sp. CBA3605]AVK60920.1 sugar transporter [Lactobacillus sp. CBA3605]
MKLILTLVPAIAWGALPLAVSRIKSNPRNQIFGTAVGALLVGLLTVLVIRPAVTTTDFMLGMVAGAFWVLGQVGQYNAYQAIGVARTMPLSTGLQLIGTTLIGVIIFGEWHSAAAKLLGFIGILLLVLGIVLTSVHQPTQTTGRSHQALVTLVFTTIGYWVYSAIPKVASTSGIALFLPEAVGMVLAVLIYLLVTHDFRVIKEPASWQTMIAGVFFSIGAIAYIYSVSLNGVNIAFVVSQLSVVISTLGGLLFLHEARHGRALVLTLLGLGLIVVGAVLTTVIK